MRLTSVKEFRDKATRMSRSTEPILVLRHGDLAGIYFPQPGRTLPLEFKRELFAVLSADIAQRLQATGAREEEVLSDFKSWRKGRREARRRRERPALRRDRRRGA